MIRARCAIFLYQTIWHGLTRPSSIGLLKVKNLFSFQKFTKKILLVIANMEYSYRKNLMPEGYASITTNAIVCNVIKEYAKAKSKAKTVALMRNATP